MSTLLPFLGCEWDCRASALFHSSPSMLELLVTQFLFFFMHLIYKFEPHFVIGLSFEVVKKTPKCDSSPSSMVTKFKFSPSAIWNVQPCFIQATDWIHWNQCREYGLFLNFLLVLIKDWSEKHLFRYRIASIVISALWFWSLSTSGEKFPLP